MPLTLPEILYGSSNSAESKKIGKLLTEKKIRKILPKAYTSNFDDPDEVIIKRHLFPLIYRHYPDSLLSHRTALEYAPSPLSNIYLTSTQNRVVRWPGVTLKFTKGHEKLDNDHPIFKGLCVSSMERAVLENLSSCRSNGGELKTVPEEVIEEKLLVYLDKAGEKGLNAFRDKAGEVAGLLGMQKEFEILNEKISAILSTHPKDVLTSPVAMARAFGEPYDPDRVNLFQKLAGVIRNTAFESLSENAMNRKEFETFAFFESYFSNYIEGTTFDVEEAIDIIYKNKEIPNRSGDTHDVKGTFEICSNKLEMREKPSDSNEFIELLRSRHVVIFRGRPEKEPGMFKEKANRAGNTHFVLPRMVTGTLKAGFDGLASLPFALGRAIYMMFVVCEVHPFNDGNGRIARIMMNAELVQAGEQRILIPTAYREDYIGAIRKLTRQRDPDAYIRMLERIQKYSKWLQPKNFDSMLAQLRKSNALEEPDRGKLQWV